MQPCVYKSYTFLPCCIHSEISSSSPQSVCIAAAAALLSIVHFTLTFSILYTYTGCSFYCIFYIFLYSECLLLSHQMLCKFFFRFASGTRKNSAVFPRAGRHFIHMKIIILSLLSLKYAVKLIIFSPNLHYGFFFSAFICSGLHIIRLRASMQLSWGELNYILISFKSLRNVTWGDPVLSFKFGCGDPFGDIQYAQRLGVFTEGTLKLCFDRFVVPPLSS